MPFLSPDFPTLPKLHLQFHSLSSKYQTPFILRTAHCPLPIHFKFRTPRVPSPVVVPVRASFSNATASAAGIRPGAAVASDRLAAEVRKRVTDAVDACGGRVTVGDVASRAGLKLQEAQKALQALVADTAGFLEVSNEGDVLYVFPGDYRSKLAAKSFLFRIEPVIDKAKDTANYLIQVTFGTTLIASIIIVFATIIFILASTKSDGNESKKNRKSDNTRSTLYFRSSHISWFLDTLFNGRQQRRQTDDREKMNFIESVFSFVFGDGDPNQGIEEKRWKLIGQFISYNGGVVAAEELAPYLDIRTAEIQKDESYILPVLLRFDGSPEVDEAGNILYRFTSLQRTASPQRRGQKDVGKRWADCVGGVEKRLQEKKWELSKTGDSERAMVIALGTINVCGVIILGALLRDIGVTQNGWIKFVSAIFPLLQMYAGSFFVVPLARWFFILKQNADIVTRNKAREQCARALESPEISLKRKLLSARDMAQRTVIGQDNIVFSTEKDILMPNTGKVDSKNSRSQIEKNQ